jgi:hypothetical protein
VVRNFDPHGSHHNKQLLKVAADLLLRLEIVTRYTAISMISRSDETVPLQLFGF